MRNKILLITLTILLVTSVIGCVSENTDDASSDTFESIETVQVNQNPIEENPVEQNPTEENTTEETSTEANPVEEDETIETEVEETAESVDLTFADLAVRQFEFSSGAGAWSEEFTIEKDGYFTGKYHDSDMGSTGEGYEKGTRYIYTESYCLGGTDTFTIYLPGTPLEELPEGAYSWLRSANQSEEELTMIAIVDETNGYGIYSYERLEPLEDAQMNFHSYKESYDYYSEKLSAANTTLEMVECTGTMYEISDDCLNYIWNLVRYNVDEDEFNEILAEQREWIAAKEAAAEEARAAYSDGSLATVNYNSTLADLTIKRCEELIEYLK